MKEKKVTKGEKESYDEMISKGPFRFILLRGVLYWGVLTALLDSLLMSFFGGEESFIEVISYSIWIFPLGGIGWGGFMWWWLNRQNLVVDEPEG